MSLINTVAADISSDNYWSNTECKYNGSVFQVFFGNGHASSVSKTTPYKVRCVLAF